MRLAAKQEGVTSHGDEEDEPDKSDCRAERSVAARQVVRLYDAVLINEQRASCEHSGKSQPPEMRADEKHYQCGEHQRVDSPSDPQRPLDSESLRDRMKSTVRIEVVVLTGIQHVEP